MNRRRFIGMLACTAAGVSLPGLVRAAGTPSMKEYSWNGFLLGAEGSFRLYSDDASRAHRVIEVCFQEIRRLERIFSLYDSSSSITQLNRHWHLRNPPPELIEVFTSADAANRVTSGAFDPTIQPLWKLYADHFESQPDDESGPSDRALANCLERVGWQHLEWSEVEICFCRPGMALTLNGIAQGYITDRVSDVLRHEGFVNTLVELGETRALGGKPDGVPWRLGILEATRRDSLLEIVELENRALASSGGYGSPFDHAGKFHHLLDSRTGMPSTEVAGVSVLADSAVEADALSTGLCIAESAVAESLSAARPDLRIIRQPVA